MPCVVCVGDGAPGAGPWEVTGTVDKALAWRVGNGERGNQEDASAQTDGRSR